MMNRNRIIARSCADELNKDSVQQIIDHCRSSAMRLEPCTLESADFKFAAMVLERILIRQTQET